MVEDLFDLRSLGNSFEGASSLTYLINGSLKGVDGYIKKLIDESSKLFHHIFSYVLQS